MLPHVGKSGLWNLGKFCLLNWAQGIRNTPNDWNPESTFHWQGRQNPESWIQYLESRVQRVNPESKIVLNYNWKIFLIVILFEYHLRTRLATYSSFNYQNKSSQNDCNFYTKSYQFLALCKFPFLAPFRLVFQSGFNFCPIKRNCSSIAKVPALVHQMTIHTLPLSYAA